MTSVCMDREKSTPLHTVSESTWWLILIINFIWLRNTQEINEAHFGCVCECTSKGLTEERRFTRNAESAVTQARAADRIKKGNRAGETAHKNSDDSLKSSCNSHHVCGSPIANRQDVKQHNVVLGKMEIGLPRSRVGVCARSEEVTIPTANKKVIRSATLGQQAMPCSFRLKNKWTPWLGSSSKGLPQSF